MARLQKEVVYGVNRIRTVFVDGVGNQRLGTGSGFWVKGGGLGSLFVTNKHNVDPKLLFPREPDFSLHSVEVEARRCGEEKGQQTFHPETKFFPVANLKESLSLHQTADCALVRGRGVTFDSGFEPFEFPDSYLADARFLKEEARMMDALSFIGFPGGRGGEPWWDQKWSLPVARRASISSVPGRPYEHKGVRTADAMLVEGLSFGGSSGSPVFFHEIGQASGFGAKDHVPDRIIGIMSGHWWAESDEPEIFHHTGLSYMTTSRSILELIDSHYERRPAKGAPPQPET